MIDLLTRWLTVYGLGILPQSDNALQSSDSNCMDY